MNGFVYLFASDSHFYKIGRSDNPESRVKVYSTLPWNIRLIHKISTNDMAFAEAKFHVVFADKRRSGEWFALNHEDVAWIVGIASLTTSEQGFDVAMNHVWRYCPKCTPNTPQKSFEESGGRFSVSEPPNREFP